MEERMKIKRELWASVAVVALALVVPVRAQRSSISGLGGCARSQ
jgi:hypothetical protein